MQAEDLPSIHRARTAGCFLIVSMSSEDTYTREMLQLLPFVDHTTVDGCPTPFIADEVIHISEITEK